MSGWFCLLLLAIATVVAINLLGHCVSPGKLKEKMSGLDPSVVLTSGGLAGPNLQDPALEQRLATNGNDFRYD